MFSESSMFLHNPAAHHRPASDAGEQFGVVQKLVVFLMCVAIAGGTALAVAAPFAALHLR